jgi:hypothetical protein
MKWLALLAAGCSSGLFIMRNIAPIVVEHARNQALICLGIVGSLQLAFVLSMKLGFYYSVED